MSAGRRSHKSRCCLKGVWGARPAQASVGGFCSSSGLTTCYMFIETKRGFYGTTLPASQPVVLSEHSQSLEIFCTQQDFMRILRISVQVSSACPVSLGHCHHRTCCLLPQWAEQETIPGFGGCPFGSRFIRPNIPSLEVKDLGLGSGSATYCVALGKP